MWLFFIKTEVDLKKRCAGRLGADEGGVDVGGQLEHVVAVGVPEVADDDPPSDPGHLVKVIAKVVQSFTRVYKVMECLMAKTGNSKNG